MANCKGFLPPTLPGGAHSERVELAFEPELDQGLLCVQLRAPERSAQRLSLEVRNISAVAYGKTKTLHTCEYTQDTHIVVNPIQARE